MPFTFYGRSAPLILSTGVTYLERARVAGSNASDGPITGPIGQRLAAIDGAAWQVFLEYSTDGGVTWLESPSTRDPVVTPTDGLLVALYAFYNSTQKLIEGFLVHFIYLNPVINPPGPNVPQFGFTLPPNSFRPQPPTPPIPAACGCKCRCSCHRPLQYKLAR